MKVALVIAGIAMILFVAHDVFDGMLVPGRMKRRFGFVPFYFHAGWTVWAKVARKIKAEQRRERALRIFGPLALVILIAFWVLVLLAGFALIQVASTGGRWPDAFFEALYETGSRMFTLGAGDSANHNPMSKLLAVLEAASGLGVVTMTISYLPVLYQLFSRRETHVILLDERAGSPVTAYSLLRNHARGDALPALEHLLADWEGWAAELVNSHVSYPMLNYYRSSPGDQAWLTGVAVVMDTCALRIAGIGDFSAFQAEATLSICIAALDSIAQMIKISPSERTPGRVSESEFQLLNGRLYNDGVSRTQSGDWKRLSAVISIYEPLLAAIAGFLCIELPVWVPAKEATSQLEAVRDSLRLPA